MPDQAVAACTNHPQREAIGVCVRCRTRVCSECATKVEGINYCVSCLAGLAVEGGRGVRVRGKRARSHAYFAATGYLLLLSGLMWLMLEVVMPGSF